MTPQVAWRPTSRQLLEKRFTNLTEHLSGDAIKDYPNLANIPTRTWKSAIYNGGIYGIPIPRGAIGSYNFIRQDLFEAAGVSTEPKSYDELVDAGEGADRPEEAALGVRHAQPAAAAPGPDERRARTSGATRAASSPTPTRPRSTSRPSPT